MASPNLLSLTTITGNANIVTPGTTNTLLVTCSASTLCKISSIYLSANGDTSNTFTIKYGTQIYAKVDLGSNAITELVINQPLYLTENQSLYVVADNAVSAATCTLVYETLG